MAEKGVSFHAQTLTDEQKAQARKNIGAAAPGEGGGGGMGGADWNAAEGEPGHVLNRTHWSDGVETVEILPTCTPMYDEDEGWFVLADAPALGVGKNYTVNYNGTEYRCVGIDSTPMGEPGVYVGDLYTATGGQVGTAPTGEPFVILSGYAEGVQIMMILDLTGATEVTLYISETRENIHKLDNKYLDLDWLPVSKKTDIIQKQTVEISALGQIQVGTENFYYEVADPFGAYPAQPTIGSTATVEIDGATYQAVCYEFDGQRGFVNPNADPEDITSILIGGKVAFLWFDAGKYQFYMVLTLTPGTYTVNVYTEAAEKMPEKYLPPSVPLLFNVPFTVDLVGQEATCDLSFAEVYEKASNFNTITRCVVQASGLDQVSLGALAAIGSNELTFSVAMGVDSSTAQIFTIILQSDDTCNLVITRV